MFMSIIVARASARLRERRRIDGHCFVPMADDDRALSGAGKTGFDDFGGHLFGLRVELLGRAFLSALWSGVLLVRGQSAKPLSRHVEREAFVGGKQHAVFRQSRSEPILSSLTSRFCRVAELMSTQNVQWLICYTRAVTRERSAGPRDEPRRASAPTSSAAVAKAEGERPQSRPGSRTKRMCRSCERGSDILARRGAKGSLAPAGPQSLHSASSLPAELSGSTTPAITAPERLPLFQARAHRPSAPNPFPHPCKSSGFPPGERHAKGARMTTRIDARFAALAAQGRAALVTFVMAGDPDPRDFARHRARAAEGRRRRDRTRHAVHRSDGRRSGDPGGGPARAARPA